jgi:hypothetical protein
LPTFLGEAVAQSLPCCDEIYGVGADGVDAFVLDVLPVLSRQFEPGPELGFLQGGEGVGDLKNQNSVSIIKVL